MTEQSQWLHAQQTGDGNNLFAINHMTGDIIISPDLYRLDLDIRIKYTKSAQEKARHSLKLLHEKQQLYSQPRPDEVFRQKYLPLLVILVLASVAYSLHIILGLAVGLLGLVYYFIQWLPRQANANAPELANMQEETKRLNIQISEFDKLLQKFNSEMSNPAKETKIQ